MKYFKFNELKSGSKITLQLPNECPINGEVIEASHIFFIKYTDSNTGSGNDIFFTKCGITDPEQFVRARRIKGPLAGAFPEVDSAEELYKVLHYIEDFYDEISTHLSINRMSENLLSEIDNINKSTKILYEKYIKFISYLWSELKSPSIIDLYDPSFTHDKKMQKFRSMKINRNNTIYVIKSFGWIEQQDCIFIHLKDDKSHFGLKLYRNRENVSMSDIMLLTYVFDMISHLLTEYSCESVWVRK